MSAYVVFDITVRDPERFEEYRKLAPPSIEAYGGKYISRGGAMDVLEGDWSPKRVVILEFETIDMARKWFDSPEYAEARALRQNAATFKAVAVEGL